MTIEQSIKFIPPPKNYTPQNKFLATPLYQPLTFCSSADFCRDHDSQKGCHVTARYSLPHHDLAIRIK